MASLGKKYVAGDTSTEQRDYEDLPTGIYRLEIEASDVIDTGPEDRRTGIGLKYTAAVIEPEELKGRKFFGFINLENSNPQAQEIGQREFACLRRACGLDEIEESEDLHFIAYTVKLGMGKPSKKVHPKGHPQEGQPVYPARLEAKTYYFDDDGEGGHRGNMPTPAIDENQPTRAQVPANDNRASARPAAQQQPAAGGAAKKRPW